MPAISKIRLTNVVYENGQKRYHDELFLFDGLNGALVLENGGGKTVFIQTVVQAVIPHATLADRDIKDTLYLEEGPAHIAIEWIVNESPRRYVVTAVTLHKKQNGIDSLRYVYEYGENDSHSITDIPFVQTNAEGIRPSDRGEMADYYASMERNQGHKAKTFSKSIKSFTAYIEENHQIIHSEWESIIKINGGEGDVEKFFDNCKKTNDLVDRLLIPSIENAMEGFKEHGFAETFENRRAEFKKYKDLKETIEQSKQLNQELKVYVDSFRKVDEKEQKYNEVRQQAKGYMLLLEEEMQQITKNLAAIEEQGQRHKDKMIEWERKKDSLALHKQLQKWREFEKKQQQLSEQLNELQDQIEANRQSYYSLLYAQAREASELENAQLKLVEKQLAKLEEKQEIADLQWELDQVSGKIHFAFLKEKQQLEEQIKSLEASQNQLTQDRDLLKHQQSVLQADILTHEQQKMRAITTLENTQEQMKDIKSKLVAREEESIEQLLEGWIAESEKLDRDNIVINQRLKIIKDLQFTLGKQQKDLQLVLQEDGLSKAKLEEQRDHILEQERALLTKLATLRGTWSHIHSIYEREQSLTDQIASQIEKLEKEKETKLTQERRAKRFIDDYEHQESFFADPFIEQRIKDWAQNYYITTGIEFIQQHAEEMKGNSYPFWAITLITTATEKPTLLDKLKSVQHELTYPIYILSLDEAREIGAGYTPQNTAVEPSNWIDYQDQHVFVQYKQDMQEIAKQRENERRQTEIALRDWQQAKQSLKEFVEKYPYTLFKEAEEQLFTLNTKIENNQYERNRIDGELHKLNEEDKAKQSTLSQNKEFLQDLTNHRIPQANQYIQLSNKLPNYQKEVKRCELKIQEQGELQDKLKDKLRDIGQQIDQLKARISELQSLKKYKIEEDSLYVITQGSEPTAHEENLEVLRRQYQSIDEAIKKIQSSRGELLERKKSCLEKIEAAKNTMKTQLEEWSNLDTTLVFPVDGVQTISALRSQYKTMDKQESELNKQKNKAEVDANTEKRTLDQLQANFNELYDELWPIEEEINVVKERLKQQKQELQNEARFMHEREQQLSRQQTQCKNVEQIFNQYTMVHRLVDPALDPQPLTEEKQNDYSYNKITITNEVMNRLQQTKQQFNHAFESLNGAKEDFISYAEKNVKDPTLRKTTIDGVKIKKTFAEILEHEQLMSERIENVIQLAENTMRDHDKELQQFITYIHMHIRKLRDDLLEIQKKTRVKVDNESKYIYKIDVPDWDDDVAKERIQGYIDWILSQLETTRYLDDSGEEDDVKVQKFLQNSFKTVPILRIVLGNQSIKVKCRKVESATHISKTFYTWEESNRWSGGEKWSKNMALFLGLLNFIAEKSQRSLPHTKRNRTVILDNPFGKASSDHVLSPVFFIADQLGFQLITLTAHAEGKFLSDYFPIVYSCRLKQLEGQSKQVLTKDKILQKAYLRDHAPESLIRLGERQQLLLFE